MASDLDIQKSLQLKVSLKEKVDVLKELDREILNLVKPDNMADKIEGADEFNENIYTITVRNLQNDQHQPFLPAPQQPCHQHITHHLPTSLNYQGLPCNPLLVN